MLYYYRGWFSMRLKIEVNILFYYGCHTAHPNESEKSKIRYL